LYLSRFRREVNLHKEVIEEQKTVDIPVTREEVVIERRAINNKPSDEPIGDDESIHIPVMEEKIDIDKHTVITGAVPAFKRAVEDTEQVSSTLKKEEARVDTDGDPNIVSGEISNLH